jgi:O-methyltransferase involved in polyketide biosynthesis
MAPAGTGLIVPSLAGVPNTMLWALHNRATEATRSDRILDDPGCLRIHRSIDYDFDRNFGIPSGLLAARAAKIDDALRLWIARHPNGIVVSLGEGLETQGYRVDNGRVCWISVDLPEAITLRERFLIPTDRFRHIAISALDPTWMDAVDPMADVFIIAQGLLMYLQPAKLRTLFAGMCRRFPGAEIVFDVVPRWYSRLTLRGLNRTPYYRLPPMPWGINRDEVEPTLRDWMPNLDSITFLDYRAPRGWSLAMAGFVRHLPIIKNGTPTLVQVVLAREALASNILTAERRTMTSFENVCDAARRNAVSGNGLTSAAGQIVAKRLALGIAAIFDPMGADYAEFARMVPEKIEAFSASGIIVMHQVSHVSKQISRFVSDAIGTATRATIAIAASANPADMLEKQSRFAARCFQTGTSNFMAIGMLALNAQNAAMLPIQQTVSSNAKRLG